MAPLALPTAASMGAAALAGLLASLGLLLFVTTLWRPAAPAARAAGAAAAAAGTLCYLVWRLGHAGALPWDGSAEAVWMGAFLAVETACLASFLSLALMLSRSTARRRHAEADAGERRHRALAPGDHPSVDVWIATYNEDWAILERTIVAARAIDWPAGRLAVWVLDDGRRPWLARACADLGVGYLIRPDNRGRKAGNHTNALARTGAPFILSVDADFVVYPDILYRTVGLMDDPAIAAVQTPQAYFNADPTCRALGLEGAAPVGFDGIDLFYRSFQPARDAWGAAFYCGTSALLRRRALEDIGGFVTETDIEDQATSVKLLSRGWRIAFLNEVLSNGLAAESGAAYHDQRNRWCRGSLQICFTAFGPFGRGLTPMQRLLFLQAQWVVGSIYPLVFLLAPAVVWWTGWQVFPDTGAAEASTAPLMAVLLLTLVSVYLTWVTERLWLPILSQACQVYTAVRQLPTALTTLVKPFGCSLIRILPVTLKGAEAGGGGLNRSTALPLGAAVGALLGGMLWRLGAGAPLALQPEAILALLFWTAFNVAVGAVALRACWEPAASGREPWFAVEGRALLAGGAGADHPVHLEALSVEGAVVAGLDAPALAAIEATGGVLTVDALAPVVPLPVALPLVALPPVTVAVHRRLADGPEDGRVWLRFVDPPEALRHRLILDLYARPDRTTPPEEAPPGPRHPSPIPAIRLRPFVSTLVRRVLWS